MRDVTNGGEPARVAVRADASAELATGHVMRCLTLANELVRQGYRVRFICRELPAHLRETIARDHELAIIGPGDGEPWPAQCATGDRQRRDAAESRAAMSGEPAWDWLIVDHYGLSAEWEQAMRGAASQILAIDDLADRDHACDVLLDQNFHRDMEARYVERVPAKCLLLLGPRYALLRDEFHDARRGLSPRREVRRVLVGFGGLDRCDYTGMTLATLADLRLTIKTIVALGAGHPRRKEIASFCTARGYELHVQTSRMAYLIAGADLGIGAGGSTCWERCCLGLPSICVATTEPERPVVDGLSTTGAALVIPGSSDYAEALVVALRALLDDPARVEWMSRSGMQLVDGEGVRRVAAMMAR